MRIRIEDNYEDVLGKAARGLALGAHELGIRSRLPEAVVRSLMAGEAESAALRQLAPVLELDGDALVALAEGRIYPDPIEVPGLVAYMEPFPVPGYAEMTVNSYLLWNKETREAFVFDTGATGGGLLETLQSKELRLKAILLTHTHADHIAALDTVLEASGNPPVYVHEREASGVPGARAFHAGQVFELGGVKVEARLTDGHSPGGCSYVIPGLDRPVAIVGDSIFCLSQGGAAADQYDNARANNQTKLLSLPEETVLCPGHGPMTTVGFEKAHNPFYAGNRYAAG